MKKHRWKLILLFALIAAVAVGVQQLLWRQRVANEYDRINTQLIEAQKFEEAAAQIEALLKDAPPEMKGELRAALLVCYKGVGSDVGRSLQGRAEWLRKAKALDPSSITPQEQRELDLADKMTR